MGVIKRELQRFVSSRQLDLEQSVGLIKANGMIAKEMYDAGPEVFESGNAVLPEGSHGLRVNEMDRLHIESCELCNPDGLVVEGCYFRKMRECLIKGWKVPVEEALVSPKYHTNGNYPSVALYQENFSAEFEKMKAHGVIKEAEPSRTGIISPMSAVIKNSDKLRAKALVRIEVKDQVSLQRANQELSLIGEKGIKIRVATDLTATGINNAAVKPMFAYPSIQDGLKLVTKNCWLGKTDLERYFFAFPLAPESYSLFMIMFMGIVYYFVRAMFGFSTCPHYASTWSAEFNKWIRNKGVKAAHMMDDFLVAGNSEAEARANLATITTMFLLIGIGVAIEKEEVGQRLVFLGLLIDTVRMVISFDATQARSMYLQLSEYLKIIEQGKDLDETTIRSVAGKLQWYSEVLQSGRVHLRSWWLYVRYRSKVTPKIRYKLIKDTEWWLEKLKTWAKSGVNDIEYPIMSVDELRSETGAIFVVSSDASGPDGFGYYYGQLDQLSPPFYSRRWGDGYEFVTSHTGELQALRCYLRNHHAFGSKVLVWTTDCLAAVWSVNKGRCREDSGLVVLEEIFSLCDESKVQLVALWLPREENILCDLLSHLSTSLNREEYSGRSLQDLCSPVSDGSVGGQAEMVGRVQASREPISRLVYRTGMEFVPNLHL